MCFIRAGLTRPIGTSLVPDRDENSYLGCQFGFVFSFYKLPVFRR